MTSKQYVISNYPEALAQRKKKTNGQVCWLVRLNRKDKPIATTKTQKEAWELAAEKIAPTVLTKALGETLKQKPHRPAKPGD